MNRVGLITTLLAASCANLGQFVWVEDYVQSAAAAQAAPSYVITPGDVISVRVFGQDGMSAHGRVRADGKLSLPLLNDVTVAGYTPNALAEQLQIRLKEFIHLPVVTVSLDEQRAVQISILGELAKPGQYPLDTAAGLGVLQAIAMAGGLTDFAHHDRIFVLRQTPAPVRIRFRYETLVRGEPPAALFRLQGGDVLVVQ